MQGSIVKYGVCHVLVHSNAICVALQASLRPRCGRLVGFNASNYHGVQAVLSGRRCALAMWYTLDAAYSEVSHKRLRHVLDRVLPVRDEL